MHTSVHASRAQRMSKEMHVHLDRGELLELVVFRIGLLAAIRSKCTKGEPICLCVRQIIS